MSLPKEILRGKFRKFVQEDVGHGDVTTFYVIPLGTVVEAEVIAKEKGMIAGVEEALTFAETFGLQAKALVEDGSKIRSRTPVMRINGDPATLLTIERTLLNLLSRMSGIATHTNRLVEKIRSAGYKTIVAATRKTMPGMSYFDKRAVMIGSGDPHRWGLDDMILLKDNHIKIAGSISQAVARVRERASFSKRIEVEVANLGGVLEAAKAKVDIIMLDNFTPRQVGKAVDLLKANRLRDKVLVEASGGVTEQTLVKYARAGVDVVSLGEITQSVRALDVSLEITKVKRAVSS